MDETSMYSFIVFILCVLGYMQHELPVNQTGKERKMN